MQREKLRNHVLFFVLSTLFVITYPVWEVSTLQASFHFNIYDKKHGYNPYNGTFLFSLTLYFKYSHRDNSSARRLRSGAFMSSKRYLSQNTKRVCKLSDLNIHLFPGQNSYFKTNLCSVKCIVYGLKKSVILVLLFLFK